MTGSTLQRRKCLVLNKNWTPIGTVTLENAICKVFNTYADGTPKARIIEPSSYQALTWADWSKLTPEVDEEKLAGSNTFFKIPEIIILSRYERLPKPRVHFSRRTLYKRDRMTCQYCGATPGSEELSIDHVVPRSLGGTTTWENCVLACVSCNRKKADKTLKKCGMKLLKDPKKPDLSLFNLDVVKPIKSWSAFINTAYWNVELDNEND